MSTAGLGERVFPIGALSWGEVSEIRADPLCADTVSIDALMEDWRWKAAAYPGVRRGLLGTHDSELLPLRVSQDVAARVAGLLSSYRAFLPRRYELALVPVSRLVSAQRYIDLDHARSALGGASGRLADDDVARYCVGTPVGKVEIEASFLGYPKDETPAESTYVYQFSSEDQNVRHISLVPARPILDLDIAGEGRAASYEVKSIPVCVGPGLPFVHILKVPEKEGEQGSPATSRLIVSNGLHRIFRLAELGNTHVAAIVQGIGRDELPETFVETPRGDLLGPGALRVTDFLEPSITRAFAWRKTRRVIRLTLKVLQEATSVA